MTGLHVGFRVCPHRIRARCPATCARSPWTLHTRVSVCGLVRTPVGRGLRAGGPRPCPRTRVRPLPAAGLPGVARSLPTRVSGGGRGRPPQQTPGRGGRKGRRVGVPASPRPPRFTSVRRERDREVILRRGRETCGRSSPRTMLPTSDGQTACAVGSGRSVASPTPGCSPKCPQTRAGRPGLLRLGGPARWRGAGAGSPCGLPVGSQGSPASASGSPRGPAGTRPPSGRPDGAGAR